MAQDPFLLLSEYLRCNDGDPETCAILFLNSQLVVLDTEISKGRRNTVLLPHEKILLQCRTLHARYILIFHTHPSGNPQPSNHDLATTRKLCIKLRRQRQRLLDHIILTRTAYFSFRKNGML